jgi:hypothetical protein
MSDKIDHPDHYTQGDVKCPACGTDIECIDVTKKMCFRLGNVVKYIWRWKKKNGIEDLKKARWYLDHFIKSIEK